MAFTSSSMLFSDEIDTLELVSLYVENYKSLQKLHINLNPKFDTRYEEDGTLFITDVKLYDKKEEYSNVKLLCGENGVGKTSVLELLRRPNLSKNNILVMKTSSNKFISNSKVCINYNGIIYNCNFTDRELSFSELSIEQSLLFEEIFSFEKNFLGFYFKEKMLFNDIDKHLLTHFEIISWQGDEAIILMLDSIRNKLQIPHISSSDLEDLKNTDMLSYLFYRNFGDNTFDDWVSANITLINEIIQKLNRFNVVDILIRVRKIFYDPKESDEIFKIIDGLKSIIDHEYSIEDYSRMFIKFTEFSKEFDRLMHEPHNNTCVHHWGNEVDSLFYFRGYKKIGNSNRYLGSMSKGEFISIRNRYHLYAKMLQSDSAIILEDEPDIHLHPEWARIFIRNFFDAVGRIRQYLCKTKNIKYKNKIYNFVLTTHSPIILSDFFNNEVIFFQKNNNIVSINNFTSNCFAGNIASLLIDNLFLKKTIGEYSESKINDIIEAMDKVKDGHNISDEKKDAIKYLISSIGDKLLRKLLEDKFARSFK